MYRLLTAQVPFLYMFHQRHHKINCGRNLSHVLYFGLSLFVISPCTCHTTPLQFYRWRSSNVKNSKFYRLPRKKWITRRSRSRDDEDDSFTQREPAAGEASSNSGLVDQRNCRGLWPAARWRHCVARLDRTQQRRESSHSHGPLTQPSVRPPALPPSSSLVRRRRLTPAPASANIHPSRFVEFLNWWRARVSKRILAVTYFRYTDDKQQTIYRVTSFVARETVNLTDTSSARIS